MKPLLHAKSSVRKWGGKVEDYLPIHDYFDSSKAALADVRHRAIFHSAFGIYIIEHIFGTYITNSDGKQVSVRDIGEQHVVEDLGFIPSMEQWLRNIPMQDWMNGKRTKKNAKHIPMEEKKKGEFNICPVISIREIDGTRVAATLQWGNRTPDHITVTEENREGFYLEGNTD